MFELIICNILIYLFIYVNSDICNETNYIFCESFNNNSLSNWKIDTLPNSPFVVMSDKCNNSTCLQMNGPGENTAFMRYAEHEITPNKEYSIFYIIFDMYVGDIEMHNEAGQQIGTEYAGMQYICNNILYNGSIIIAHTNDIGENQLYKNLTFNVTECNNITLKLIAFISAASDFIYFDNIRIIGDAIPTNNPTIIPTNIPTIIPTNIPTLIPTTNYPTLIPTKLPTNIPSLFPTDIPSNIPTKYPSKEPSNEPSIITTVQTTNNLGINNVNNKNRLMMIIIGSVVVSLIIIGLIIIIIFIKIKQNKNNLSKPSTMINMQSISTPNDVTITQGNDGIDTNTTHGEIYIDNDIINNSGELPPEPVNNNNNKDDSDNDKSSNSGIYHEGNHVTNKDNSDEELYDDNKITTGGHGSQNIDK